jgi:hypothetical protein
MPNLLDLELKAILAACQEAEIPVFVIGAFSVRAYDCLVRVSQDLDLALSSAHWPPLKQVLIEQGYTLSAEAVWITATKTTAQDLIEINIALDAITDLNSASAFPITHCQPKLRQPSDLDFSLPVLSLESIFITKLIAQRDKDVADLLAILLLQPGSLNPQRFWDEVEEAGLLLEIPGRLDELVERIQSGEAMSMWFERTSTILSGDETELALAQLHRLQKIYPY